MSEITIQPDFAEKTAAISGSASAGEKVSVVLKNCAALKTPTLRLRVLWLKRLLAVYPVPVDDGGEQDAFEEDGDDLVCTLNLCTVQAMKTFRRVPELEVMFILDDVGESVRQMHFRDFHTLLGWPQNEGTDVPVDLSGYINFVADTNSRLSAVENVAETNSDAIRAETSAREASDNSHEAQIGVLETSVYGLSNDVEATGAQLASHVNDGTIHLSKTHVKETLAEILATKTYDVATLDGLTETVAEVIKILGGTANEK